MIKNLSINSRSYLNIHKKPFHDLIAKIKRELNFTIVSLDINILSSDEILEINKKYLKHNYTTDIITFNYSGDNNKLDGELFISLNDAENNSKRYRCSLNKEILRLVIHGILHLVGFDDQKDNEKKKMKRMENKLVNYLYNHEQSFIEKI